MEVDARQQRLVVQHLLEVGHQPLAVDRVAGEPAADVVVHAARRHRVERGGDGDEDALLEAAVGELEAGDDVADGADAGHVGRESLVGDDEAAVDRDADLLVAEAVRRRAAADGDEQQLGLDGLAVLERDDDAVVVLRDALEADAELVLDAALAERALELLAETDSSSFGTRWGSASMIVTSAPNDFHTLANSTPMTPPPSTATLLGHEVELERLLAGDDPAADLEAGQRPRVRAGREDDVLAGDAVVADLHRRSAATSRPSPSIDGDAAGLDEPLQALELARDDALRGRP